MLTESERLAALRRARRSIERAVDPDRSSGLARTADPTIGFAEPRGVFVTLRHYPDEELRGCIGYPLPVLPLGEALERAAVSAAIEDPRFRPVRPAELPHLTVEVSVLSAPEPISAEAPEAIAADVRVGRDGLIVESRGHSGLLLPQVAPEQGWTAEEFLAGACEKAGLAPGAWRRPGVKIFRFEAQVFREGSPGGPLVDAPPTSPGDARSARRR